MTADESGARELAEQIDVFYDMHNQDAIERMTALLLPLIRDQGRYRYVREHRHYALLCGREGFGYSFSQVEHWSNEQNVALLDKEVDKARGET